MKKHIRTIVAVLIMVIVACIIPFPDSDVNLNLYFENLNTDEFEESSFRAYYTTDESPAFSEVQATNGIVDKENNRVTFKFDSENVKKLGVIRIDFPAIEETLCINGMSVSSGGAAKKQIDPSRFLDEANIISMYDINEITALKSACSVYIATGCEDPQIVLSDIATDYIAGKQSKHIVSRIVILAIMIIGFICTKKIKW